MLRHSSLSLSKYSTSKTNSMNIKIISTKLIKNEGFFNCNFVQYIIKIKTVYKTWIINKRYSDFEQLYLKLYKKYPFINFPSFPPKRVFRFTDNTIEERKNKFNHFLYFINHKMNIYSIPEIIEFLNFDKDTLNILLKKKNMIAQKNFQDEFNYYNIINNNKSLNRVMSTLNLNQTNNFNNDSFFNDENYFISFEEFKRNNCSIRDNNLSLYVIEEFLRNLDEQNEHITEIVKTFFNFMKYKNKWKIFSKEEIIKLFIGGFITKEQNININNILNNSTNDTKNIEENNDNDIKKDLFSSDNIPHLVRGIFFHIGNYNLNYYGSKTCINFLLKLLDTEINPEAELYIQIYCSRKIDNIKLMNLPELYIKSGNDCKNCFKLIEIYLKGKYKNENELDFYLNQIGDENFSKKYKNFIQKIVVGF